MRSIVHGAAKGITLLVTAALIYDLTPAIVITCYTSAMVAFSGRPYNHTALIVTFLLPFLPVSSWFAGVISAGLYWFRWGYLLSDDENLKGICFEVLENLSQMVYVYSYDRLQGKGNFTYVSPRCKAIIGLDRESALQSTSGSYFRIHPDDRERYLAVTNESFENAKDVCLEVRYLAGDNKYHWTRIRSKVKAMSRDNLVFFGVADDVDDLVTARSDLTEEKSVVQTLEAVLSVTFDATMYIDEENKIKTDSAKLRHFFGLPKRSVQGMPFTDLLADEDSLNKFANYFSHSEGKLVPISIIVDSSNCSAELFGAHLPWPLEGIRVIGLKVIDIYAFERLTWEALDEPDETDQDDNVSMQSTDASEKHVVNLIRVEISGSILELASALARGIAESTVRDNFLSFVSIGDIRGLFKCLSRHSSGNLNLLDDKSRVHSGCIREVGIALKLAAVIGVDMPTDPLDTLSLFQDLLLKLQDISDVKFMTQSRLFICLSSCQILYSTVLDTEEKQGERMAGLMAWLEDLYTQAVHDAPIELGPQWSLVLPIEWASLQSVYDSLDRALDILEPVIAIKCRDGAPSIQLQAIALHNYYFLQEALDEGSGGRVRDKLRELMLEHRDIAFHQTCIDFIKG